MKLVCIGSGNVATHLVQAFKSAGNVIVQVWSRNIEHANALAVSTGASATDDFDAIDPDADLYLLAVKDDAIAEVAGQLKTVRGMVVHTSGATGMEVLSSLSRYGVLYPLQTFSKDRSLEFSSVPLCIEACNPEELASLSGIASEISPLIYEVNSEQRRVLHLAAVFAGNFTNHLYHLSELIVEQQGLSFELLKPLILETAAKVQQELPFAMQTGPAVRDDEQTLEKHTASLRNMPQLKEIYEILSNSIKKTHS